MTAQEQTMLQQMHAHEHKLEVLLEHMTAVLEAERVLAPRKPVDPALFRARQCVLVALENLQLRTTRLRQGRPLM